MLFPSLKDDGPIEAMVQKVASTSVLVIREPFATMVADAGLTGWIEDKVS